MEEDPKGEMDDQVLLQEEEGEFAPSLNDDHNKDHDFVNFYQVLLESLTHRRKVSRFQSLGRVVSPEQNSAIRYRPDSTRRRQTRREF